ncbi:DICT sensory domain-containing protein [Halorientalis litorea]|jgi:hypothetical protein|uniref:DICT sensory domain-containing protein n=1 Tax=Halorientalis litorea TaxID=2931977 RepID=UPI001FF54B05|nr:DICT sensory domain-containing protein [Halorientalis litorea]
MATATADSIREFIPDSSGKDLSLAVLNRTRPEPIQNTLEKLFSGQPVAVEEADVPDEQDDTVVLLRGGEVVASSPLTELEETILLVNSDLYITGAQSVTQVRPPVVLRELTDEPFHLRGYPESNSEKMPLILISRYVERLALEQSGCILRSSFQRTSRVEDERGTYNVYAKVADSDTAVHMYGVPDWVPPREFGASLHGGYTDEYQHAWFVVCVDPDDETTDHAALVAYETGPNEWVGTWTFDTDKTRRINRYIERTL